LNFLLTERAKLHQQLNAPIAKIIRSNSSPETVKAASVAFGDAVSGHKIFGDFPNSSGSDDDTDIQWLQLSGGNPIGVIVAPNFHNFAEPGNISNRDDGNLSDSSGNVVILVPNQVAPFMNTAFGGVGFGLVPTTDLTQLRITSALSYQYTWSTMGDFMDSHYTQGSLGVTVHRYDPTASVAWEWNFPETILWSSPSPGGSEAREDYTVLKAEPPPLLAGSKYGIWLYGRIYCSTEPGGLGTIQSSAWLKMRCGYMAFQSII